MEEYFEKIQSNDLRNEVKNTMKNFENRIMLNFENNNYEDMIHYLGLLYFDTISSKNLELIQENPELMISLMKNPETYFQVNFEKLFSELNNSDENNLLLKNKIKATLRVQYNDIQKKIKECDEHILFLNELFIQKKLIEKIPLTSQEKKKFELKNKKVLIFTQDKNIYGELFSRYIFSILESTEDLNLSLPLKMYDENNIFNILINKNNPNSNFDVCSKIENNNINYDEEEYNVKEFKDWNILLKYWLIYLLIYERIFSKDSNIEELTNYQFIYNLAKSVREFKKKSEGKKGKKDQSKKKKKGGTKSGNILKKIMENKNKKGYQMSSEANKFNELMNKIIITQKDNNNLNKILNGECLKNMEKKYYSNIIEIPYNKDFIPNIYDSNNNNSGIKLDKIDKSLREQIKRSVRNNNEKTKIENNFLNKITGEYIRIFQSLYSFKEENAEYIKEFLKKTYNIILFTYYFLYLKKKMIYTIYLENFKEYTKQYGILLNDLVDKNKKEKNEEENENKIENNKKFNNSNIIMNELKLNELNQSVFNKLNTERKEEYKKILEKIKYLKEKKNELEKNKNQINYDKKILIIEKLINELLIKKHQLIHSI